MEHLRFTDNELVERLNPLAVDIQDMVTNLIDGKYRWDICIDQLQPRLNGLQNEPIISVAEAANELGRYW